MAANGRRQRVLAYRKWWRRAFWRTSDSAGERWPSVIVGLLVQTCCECVRCVAAVFLCCVSVQGCASISSCCTCFGLLVCYAVFINHFGGVVTFSGQCNVKMSAGLNVLCHISAFTARPSWGFDHQLFLHVQKPDNKQCLLSALVYVICVYLFFLKTHKFCVLS